MLSGEGLRPSAMGKRVRFSGDTRTVISGPFAATSELIAGFWLWQVRSMDEAIEWVKRMPKPHREDCEIELRPVYEMDDFGDAMTPAAREQEERLRAELNAKE
jgi:hypothetical protein